MAYQVILEAGIGEVRGFESPRPPIAFVYTCKEVFCAQIDLKRAREREIPTEHSMKNDKQRH